MDLAIAGTFLACATGVACGLTIAQNRLREDTAVQVLAFAVCLTISCAMQAKGLVPWAHPNIAAMVFTCAEVDVCAFITRRIVREGLVHTLGMDFTEQARREVRQEEDSAAQAAIGRLYGHLGPTPERIRKADRILRLGAEVNRQQKG